MMRLNDHIDRIALYLIDKLGWGAIAIVALALALTWLREQSGRFFTARAGFDKSCTVYGLNVIRGWR